MSFTGCGAFLLRGCAAAAATLLRHNAINARGCDGAVACAWLARIRTRRVNNIHRFATRALRVISLIAPGLLLRSNDIFVFAPRRGALIKR